MITCPLCFSSVQLGAAARAACASGHEWEAETLARETQVRVDRALWAAIRGLEDLAAFARLRERNGASVPVAAEDAQRSVDELRRFLSGT